MENDFSGHTILVAEDTEINREILHVILHDTGLSIDYAKDGNATLAMFKENPEKYDLVLMDINMPVIDGHLTTRCIRGMEGRGKEIPIIAMTSNVSGHDIKKCLVSGMNDHIGKPVKPEELIKKLKRYLIRALPT